MPLYYPLSPRPPPTPSPFCSSKPQTQPNTYNQYLPRYTAIYDLVSSPEPKLTSSNFNLHSRFSLQSPSSRPSALFKSQRSLSPPRSQKKQDDFIVIDLSLKGTFFSTSTLGRRTTQSPNYDDTTTLALISHSLLILIPLLLYYLSAPSAPSAPSTPSTPSTPSIPLPLPLPRLCLCLYLYLCLYLCLYLYPFCCPAICLSLHARPTSIGLFPHCSSSYSPLYLSALLFLHKGF